MVTMIYHIWNFYVRHPILCLWHEWVKLLSIATKISFLDKERSMCLNREICLELKLGSPHVSGVLKIYLETQYTGCPRRNVPDIGGGGVPYVKVYRYNPKYLCPKLNGYGDNGQRSLKLWQLLHTYWLPNTY